MIEHYCVRCGYLYRGDETEHKQKFCVDAPCTCAEFKAAQDRGTDNEAYGQAICGQGGQWILGACPPITFCPWCGKRSP